MSALSVLCPYCLKHGEVKLTNVYQCQNCSTVIPRGYVERTHVPRATVGVVGFSGHGKTVFLTSLFSTIGRLSRFWPSFYYRSLDDYTHKIVYEKVPLFEQGILPDSTPANFPNPALLQYHNVPHYGECFLNYYDTAGEVFTESAQIMRAGFFVAHADVIWFIMSLTDAGARPDEEMSRLLDVYIAAVSDRFGVNLRERQRIVVVLSKADAMQKLLPDTLKNRLLDGGIGRYARDVQDRVIEASLFSLEIEDWVRNELGAGRFANMARDNFCSVDYCLVSSLGFNTAGKKSYEPLKILDPFLLVMFYLCRSNSQQKGGKRGLGKFWERIRRLKRLMF
ncbi:MAG: hypothetical protein NZ534_12110 [Bacteroidia bacterium]|nr:hypothetical protein [Bacteroidia bacterium]